ncbi:Peroxisome biosynthesis protein pex1 [Saitoella coloradoensis]
MSGSSATTLDKCASPSGCGIPPQSLAVEVSWKSGKDTKRAFTGWSGTPSPSASSIVFDPGFAQALHLSAGTAVSVTLHSTPPRATMVHVAPLTSNDWEVMELHAGYLEDHLLSQVRALGVGQKICVWLGGGGTTATVVVNSIDGVGDAGWGLVGRDAEVVVEPKPRRRRNSNASKSSKKTVSSRVGRMEVGRVQVYRMQGADGVTEDGKLCVYVPPSTACFPQSTHATISVISPPALSTTAETTAETEKQSSRAVVPVLVRVKDDLPTNATVLTDATSTALLRPPTGSKIKVIPVSAPRKGKTAKITFTPAKAIEGDAQKQEIIEAIKAMGLVGDDLRVRLCGRDGILHVEKGAVADPSACKIEIGPISENDLSSLPSQTTPPTKELLGLNPPTIVTKAKTALARSQSVYISAPDLSGKSLILSHLKHALSSAPRNAHIMEPVTSHLTQASPKQLRETFTAWWREATWYAPTVLVLDDFDRLVAAENEQGGDGGRARIVAECWHSAIGSKLKGGETMGVSVLATGVGQDSLHPVALKGFTESLGIKAPDKKGREEILRGSLNVQNVGSDIDFLEVATRTEGFLPGDLGVLVERAQHESLIRSIEADIDYSEDAAVHDEDKLEMQDFGKALEGFVPAGLRGVNLTTEGAKWTDIGGLSATKDTLLETFEFPTRYAPIFASCPLRLRSGILLYGYPGCGKTLLASAVAKECGLNFISVKGPELLNKYIGASEKSVRDLFERAQAARPCVLFFDEFDSIAPKRGHDSTGVTDRVVNQMLTQMDGAEGLEGVYVLAATSRPDLIDPALLRPGRLDKSLLCDMPSLEDRVSILEALLKILYLDPSIPLEELAERMEGYSGADLQAVLYNAHLEAIHEVLENKQEQLQEETANGEQQRNDQLVQFVKFKLNQKDNRKESLAERSAWMARVNDILKPKSGDSEASAEDDGQAHTDAAHVMIQRKHIDSSLSTTRPSISQDERQRLARVYHEFVVGRSGEMPNGMASNEIGGRETLM